MIIALLIISILINTAMYNEVKLLRVDLAEARRKNLVKAVQPKNVEE